MYSIQLSPSGTIIEIQSMRSSLRAALPQEAKTENVLVELVLRFRVLHVHADVQHVVGDALRGDCLRRSSAV